MHSSVSDQDADLRLVAECVCDADLADLIPQWRALAEDVSEPNPFLEHWFLLPSLEHFDPEGVVQLILAYSGERLVGLMPIASSADYYDRSIRHFANWQHANMFCGNPLVAGGFEQAFWAAIIEWTQAQVSSELFLHLRDLPTDGPLFAALNDVAAPRIVAKSERAFLRSGPSPDEHLATAFSKKRRKELGRKRRRLEESGQFAFERQTDSAGISDWIDTFLDLEKLSWKGNELSALASEERTAALFRDVLTGAAEAGKLERLAFHVDGKPVAMLAQFHTPPGAFSFKTCFDESLYALSPGMLLQVDNLELLNNEQIDWCDSCAAPDHPMIDRIWFDRREIVSVSIPVGRGLCRLAGQALTAIEARRMKARQ